MAARCHPQQAGYSLLEMLIVLVILLAVVSIAGPSLVLLNQSYRRLGVRQQLEADIMRARNAAQAQGTRSIITIEAGGASYGFGLDFIPYASPPAPDETSFLRLLPGEITLEPELTLMFDSRGFLVDPAGELTSTSFVLSDAGLAFAGGTVLPTGAVEFE